MSINKCYYMLPIETWLIIIIISISILIIYIIFYKMTQKKKLHNLTEEHNVSEPHNNLEFLQTFIEKCWSRGYSIPEIKEILIEKGWNEETVNKIFYKSKVPAKEENVSRLKRTLNSIKPKVSNPKPAVISTPKQRPVVQSQQKEKKKKFFTINKKKKEEVLTTFVPPEEEIDIGESGPSLDDGYKESEEVTKLKKEVLKDLKKK